MDATPLSVPTGGIRRYTGELARALAALYPGDIYYLLSDQPFKHPSVPGGPTRASWLFRRWWSIGLPRELRRLAIDVFHGTDFAVPYLPVLPSVMTLHDLSPWREETSARVSDRVRRRAPWLLRLGLATMVITPSEAVRREAISTFSLHPGRVVAVALAPATVFRPVQGPRRERPYFLCVGARDPRKNLDVVHQAWITLRDRADLVIVGESDERLRGPVYTGAVTDAELAALYSGSVALLYPSLYEGFGLPVLEAMQCGTMAIASQDPAVVEVAGGAAIHAGASDPRGWLEAMTCALDAGRRAAWRDRGFARAAEFTWERTAMRTREVYDEARRIF